MKKSVVVLGLFALFALVAAPAYAVTLTIGEKEANFGDHSNLYGPDGSSQNSTFNGTMMDPRPFGFGVPRIGDENRSIFRVTNIIDIDSANFEFNVAGPTELTGMIYNLELIAVTPLAGGALQLDFGQSTRNPLPGTPAGFGGVLEVYEDATKDFTSDPNAIGRFDSQLPTNPLITPLPIEIPTTAGPWAWVEGTGGARDAFPGTSDGSLWLSAVFVDFVTAGIAGHAPGTVFSETIDLTTGVGSGSAYANILGGSYASLIDDGFFGPFMDLSINFDLSTPKELLGPDGRYLADVAGYDGRGWWQVDSQDPAGFGVVVPEPASLSLLVLGLASVGLRIRRRK